LLLSSAGGRRAELILLTMLGVFGKREAITTIGLDNMTLQRGKMLHPCGFVQQNLKISSTPRQIDTIIVQSIEFCNLLGKCGRAAWIAILNVCDTKWTLLHHRNVPSAEN